MPVGDLDLILASTSIYRRTLLERLGVPFRCLAPGVVEDAIKGRGLTPREVAEQLAVAKAEAKGKDWPGGTLIGSDQVVAFEGRTLGKPGSIDAAIAQLEAMAGKSHELITALAVHQEGRTLTHTDVTTLRMRPLRREEIERVVRADRPIDCAGGYKLEGRGIALFESIESADQTAIIGLPLIALATILRGLGYPIP